MVKIDFKKRVSIVSLTTLTLVFTSLTIPIPAQADVIQKEECFPAVLMLKGSGEGIVDGEPVTEKNYIPSNSTTQEPFIHTNGHEGAVLGKLLKAFVDQTDPAKTVSKVRFIGIEYPALDVFPVIPDIPDASASIKSIVAAQAWANHIVKYNESYRTGAKMVTNFIEEDEQRGCNTQYMLASYSQGVISARIAMNLMNNNTDKIISSYVLGDPFQKGNGASSPRQFTAANSSPDTDGIARAGLNTLIKIGELNPLGNKSSVAGLAIYRDSIINSDPIIYRDEGEGRTVSRSLCHNYDPTCDFAMLGTDIEQHLKYFDPSLPSGQQDLNLEVSEFDKQVQTLANSTTANPRERVLTKSPSLTGGTTTYKVANARPDDKCSWDENSDGTQELVNISCRAQNFNLVSDTAKMTVTVTDSFGISYNLGSTVQIVKPEVVDEIVDAVSVLDPNTWYEFRAYSSSSPGYGMATNCLSWSQSPDYLIDENNSYLINAIRCGGSPGPASQGPWRDEVVALNVFRAESYPTSNGNKIRMVSGYDDAYSWEALDESNKIKISKTTSSPTQDIIPVLTTIIADKPYYSFRYGDKCITGVDATTRAQTILQKCDSSNFAQLFSLNPVDKPLFGKYSIEHDVTPPSAVTGAKIEVEPGKANLRVTSTSTDSRSQIVDYLIYKKGNAPDQAQYLGKAVYTLLPIDLNGATVGQLNEYSIYAVDAAGNRSAPFDFSFVTPPSIPKPSLPITSVASDKTSVTLKYMNSSEIPQEVTAVRVYRNGKYIATTPRTYSNPGEIATYVDRNVSPRDSFRYTYQYEISPNVTSIEGGFLWVNVG